MLALLLLTVRLTVLSFPTTVITLWLTFSADDCNQVMAIQVNPTSTTVISSGEGRVSERRKRRNH